MPWWAWFIVAGVFGLAELHAPGTYFIWIACGAVLTALIDAGWDLSLSAQLGVFAVASALSCGVGYFVYRQANLRTQQDADTLNQRALALVGTRGVVSVPVVNGEGKVRLGDSEWLAEAPTNLAAGTAVVVRAARGTRLIVEPSS